jgi:chorismate synthase
VALGAVARSFLAELGIRLVSHTISMGEVEVPAGSPLPRPDDVASLDADPLRCFDAETSARMIEEVDDTKKTGDTLGGIVEVLAYGLPPGLGSYVHWDRRLDSRLAGALMGIQAIKGVEVGDGFETTRRRGSVAHDELHLEGGGITRETGRAGGIEGGMTTGQVLRVRAGMKPIATVPHALPTIDTATGEEAKAHHQRSDVTAVPAAGVVAEAMVALVLADAVTEKFGGDSLPETRRNLEAYVAAIPERLATVIES